MLGTLLAILAMTAAMIAVNAFYVAGEFSSVGSRRTRISQMAEEGNGPARALLPILEEGHKLDNYIAASQVGITLSSLVLGIYGNSTITPFVLDALQQSSLSTLPFLQNADTATGIISGTVLLVLTTFQVVLGELVPKSIAIQYPERTALSTVQLMRLSANVLFKPLIMILNGSGIFFMRLMGLHYSGEHGHIHSPEEIEILVGESHKGGLLDAEERALLHNAFRIGEMTATEVMVPRTQMLALPVESTVRHAMSVADVSGFTRLPVYDQDIDHLVGFIHLKELFALYCDAPDTPTLRSILRQAPYVPETMPVVNVWQTLNDSKSYLALVFDEYGGTAGLITQEDLIEELFGELQDEFDQDEEALIEERNGLLMIRGDTPVEHLSEALNVPLPEDIANTIGGLVLDSVGRAPVVGDTAVIGGLSFRVEAVAGLSIREISIPPQEVAAVRAEESLP